MSFSLRQQFLTDFSSADSEQPPLNFGFTLHDDWSRPESSKWNADKVSTVRRKRSRHLQTLPELTPLSMEGVSAAASESFTSFAPTYLLCVDLTGAFDRLSAIQGSIHLSETRSICSSSRAGRSVNGNIHEWSRFVFNLRWNVRKQSKTLELLLFVSGFVRIQEDAIPEDWLTVTVSASPQRVP